MGKVNHDSSHSDLHSKIDAHVRDLRSSTHRLENMVQAVNAAQDQHSANFEQLHSRISASGPNSILGDIQRDIDNTRMQHDSSRTALSSRLDHLEGMLASTSDKHVERMKALEVQLAGQLKAHAAQQGPLTQRLDHLESLLLDSGRSHAQGLAAAHARLEQLHGSISEERAARQAHGASLESLKSSHANAWSDHHESRLAHGSAIEDLRKSHASIASDMESSAARHAALDQRLKAIDQLLGDNANEHAKQLLAAHQNVQNCHAKVSEEAAARGMQLGAIRDRLDKLDAVVNGSADEHTARWEAIHKGLQDLHGQLTAGLGGRMAAHASIEERIKNVELGASDHAGKVNDLHRRLNEEKDENTKRHSANAVELRGLDLHIKDTVAAQLQQVRGHVQGERESRDAQNAAVDRRFKQMEKTVADSIGDHASQLQSVRQKLQSLQSSVADAAKAPDIHWARGEDHRPLHSDSVKGWTAEECLKYMESMPAAAPRLDATAAVPSPGDMYGDRDFFRTAQKMVLQDGMRVATPPQILQLYQQPSTQSPTKTSLGRVASVPCLR